MMPLRAIAARRIAALGRSWPYLALGVVFAASRTAYRLVLGIRFDPTPVRVFIQYINPWFVQHDFLRSVLHLHQQPPLQNVLTGGCLRLFGTPLAFTVLSGLYHLLGLTVALAMLHAMLRLGVLRTVAVVAAGLYAVSPVTVCYENWLFYHLPVAALHLLALGALLRYCRTGAFGAALSCFGLFAAGSLFHALYHPLLLVVIAGALVVRPPVANRVPASRRPRATILLALAIPLFALIVDKTRTRVLVGHDQGDAFLWDNLAIKTFDALRPGERGLLVQKGLVSRAPQVVPFSSALSAYDEDLRVAHPATGVPLLDLEYTPDGAVNAHAIENVLIAETFYKKDALYLLRHRSEAYWRSVLEALSSGYFASSLAYDQSLVSPNRLRLQAIARATDALFLPAADGTQRLLVVVLPLTFVYGLYRLLGGRGRLESERSVVAALSYMLPIIAYVTVATTMVSFGDFSRYRFNIDPFYVILFALLVTDGLERAASLRRRAWAALQSRRPR
jgi:hypothetical protein